MGAAAFIQGEAEIGKTSLAVALADQALARGFRVLQGAASELERGPAIGALAQSFEIGSNSADHERADIARLLLGEVRFRLIEALVSPTEWLGLAGPVLVVIEDLHWADPSTVLLLDHLGRRLAHLRLSCWQRIGHLPGRRTSAG